MNIDKERINSFHVDHKSKCSISLLKVELLANGPQCIMLTAAKLPFSRPIDRQQLTSDTKWPFRDIGLRLTLSSITYKNCHQSGPTKVSRKYTSNFLNTYLQSFTYTAIRVIRPQPPAQPTSLLKDVPTGKLIVFAIMSGFGK